MNSTPRDVVISWLFGEGTTGRRKTTLAPNRVAFDRSRLPNVSRLPSNLRIGIARPRFQLPRVGGSRLATLSGVVQHDAQDRFSAGFAARSGDCRAVLSADDSGARDASFCALSG